jgi:hypothetical protein
MSRLKVTFELAFQVGQVRVAVRLMKGSLTKDTFVVTDPELSINTSRALRDDGNRPAQESYRSRDPE